MSPRFPRSPALLGALAVLLGAAAIAGCAARRGAKATSYHDEQMDFSLVRTVAVLPFGNLSGVQPAAERVRDVFMTALQSVGAVYVVPPGEVARGLGRVGIQAATAPSPEEVVALCKALQADAVVAGTVLEYGEARSATASANYISLSARLFEAETGRAVWSASTTRGGIGVKERLLGGGGKPMNEVTLEAVSDLIARLFE